jgi:predicted HAD superfamily Cof-like phosphohydrolase
MNLMDGLFFRHKNKRKRKEDILLGFNVYDEYAEAMNDEVELKRKKQTDHQVRVEKFMELAGQNLPDKPTVPDLETRKLRARLMLEECLETIFDGLALEIDLCGIICDDAKYTMSLVKFHEKEGKEPDLVAIADGCADISVVTTGTLSACGIADEELLEEVDKNNLAKFGPGGHRNEHGKWIKPPGHMPPDIQGLLKRQSE